MSDCPANVHDAALAAFPAATITSCKPETDHGKRQFEIKLETNGGKKIEVDISPDGKVLLVEETVPLESVPRAVKSGFAAKYAKATAQRAERQTKADGTVTYELAFQDHGKRREATFGADGSFVEEE